MEHSFFSAAIAGAEKIVERKLELPALSAAANPKKVTFVTFFGGAKFSRKFVVLLDVVPKYKKI